MIVDIENIIICVQKEEDADTKQVYFYLYKVGWVVPLTLLKVVWCCFISLATYLWQVLIEVKLFCNQGGVVQIRSYLNLIYF